ncbi:MAG: hypothetical protein JNL74_05210 [Fibrobacteres bacterium]|nr:hypothetical protein [Fibrobacterota bacterium]
MRFFSFFSFLFVFGIIAWFPVTDADIFWHLASAREMVQQGTFLNVDPFSEFGSQKPWFNMHWLFQLLVLAVYNIGALYGLIVLKCFIFGTAAFIAMRGFSGGNKPLRFAVTFLALYQVRYYLLERPVMFTVLFIVLYLYLIDKYDKERKSVFLVVIPFIQILWTNMQGLSPIGIFITGVFALEAYLRKDKMAFRHGGALLFFQAAAQFINPYGVNGVTWPLALLKRISPGVDAAYSYGVEENVPLFSLGITGNSPVPLFIMLVSLYFFYAVIQNRSFKSRGTIIVSAMALLAVFASRNITLFAFTALYFINGYLAKADEVMPSVKTSRGRALSWGLLIVIILPLLSSARNWPAYKNLNGLSPFRFCEGGAEYLKVNRISGPLFNADRSGGFLLLSGARKTVYMDGRFMLRSKGEFEEYLNALGSREAYNRLNIKYGFTHILLPLSPDGRNPELLSSISQDTLFTLCFVDGGSVLYCQKSVVPEESGINVHDALVRDSLIKVEVERWQGNQILARQSEMALKGFFSSVSLKP